jgi:hypothetical protein
MSANENPQPGNDFKTPGPKPPGPPPSFFYRILQHRFLLASLLVILFLGFLFTLDYVYRGENPEQVFDEAMKGPPSGGHETLVNAELEEGTAPPQHAPTPSGHPEAKTELPGTLRGEVFTRALIKIIDDQVNQPVLGWRPNSIIFGKMGLTDNANNFQLGVLEVARRTTVVLNQQFTRFSNAEAFDPRVNEAMNYLMVNPHKYWFPSASGKYREAMQDLQGYIGALKTGKSRFYSRVDHLIVLLNTYKDLLGSNLNNLLKDTEADGQPVSWFRTDDYFYQAQGVAVAMAEMLEAVTKDFHKELQKKNSHKILEEAIHALHQAAHMHPWVVTNGSKDGFLANHRCNMGGYIAEAEHLINTLQRQLATN